MVLCPIRPVNRRHETNRKSAKSHRFLPSRLDQAGGPALLKFWRVYYLGTNGRIGHTDCNTETMAEETVVFLVTIQAEVAGLDSDLCTVEAAQIDTIGIQDLSLSDLARYVGLP